MFFVLNLQTNFCRLLSRTLWERAAYHNKSCQLAVILQNFKILIVWMLLNFHEKACNAHSIVYMGIVS